MHYLLVSNLIVNYQLSIVNLHYNVPSNYIIM